MHVFLFCLVFFLSLDGMSEKKILSSRIQFKAHLFLPGIQKSMSNILFCVCCCII